MDQEIDYDRLVNGLQVSRNRCRFNKYKNARIQEAQSYLSTGIYSLKEFLQIFDEDTGRQQYNMELVIGKFYELYIFMYFIYNINFIDIFYKYYLLQIS